MIEPTTRHRSAKRKPTVQDRRIAELDRMTDNSIWAERAAWKRKVFGMPTLRQSKAKASKKALGKRPALRRLMAERVT